VEPARRRHRPAAILGIAAVLAASGCGSRHAGPRDTTAPAPGEVELGTATFYSDGLAGHATASGEPYRPGALTAAHRTWPFGTIVRVTRLDRDARPMGRPVVVRINDRGPYGAGRVIDLSGAAARQLRMTGAGVARVRLEVVELPRARGDRR
jgi:rare lipoprotein A